MIAIIVAVDKNYAIGKDNQLLWHITEDLKFFKATTKGGTVIMGRKTYESIGKPLPMRRNIVITRSLDFKADGVEVAKSVEDALQLAKADERVFIIGGGEIYKQAFAYADTLFITHVSYEYDADTYFPPFDLTKWTIIEQVDYEKGVNFEHAFSFKTYKKAKVY